MPAPPKLVVSTDGKAQHMQSRTHPGNATSRNHRGLAGTPGPTRSSPGPGSGKLQIVVKVEPSIPTACVVVRGNISMQSVPVVYAVVRRLTAALPGIRIVVDVGHAVTSDEAMAELGSLSRTGTLPGIADPAQKKCHVRILE